MTRQLDDERKVAVRLIERGQAMTRHSRRSGEALFARAGMQPRELVALNGEVRRLLRSLISAERA